MSHGRYSRITRTALERTVTDYIHNHGSPSERTRSRIRDRASHTAQPANLHLTTPSTGDFARSRNITRTAQARAEHRLRRSRIKLRKYLTSDRWHAEFENLDLGAPTRWRIEQLGIQEGDVTSLPRATPGTWDSPLRMYENKPRKRAEWSALSEVMINHPEGVLDEEFGVLPGETWGGKADEDWQADEDVVTGLTEDGRMLEAMFDGERMKSGWRDVVKSNPRSEDTEVVARWTIESAWAWKRRVMDPLCVEVVGRLLKRKVV